MANQTPQGTTLFRSLPDLFSKTFVRLSHNDPLRMAGATAFFTAFALPFILLLLTQLLGPLMDPHRLRAELVTDLSEVFGKQSVQQVMDTLVSFRQLAKDPWVTAVGIALLLLVSTTLLMVVRSSINQLWRVKLGRATGIRRQLVNRLRSLLFIVATGVLVVLNLVAETARAQMGDGLRRLWPVAAVYVNGALTQLFSLLFVAVWFAFLFRLLPDARPRWRTALTGGLVTSALFTVGKYLLRFLLIKSNLGTLYGASASVVLMLLFVFYASLIFYFGAAFTWVWADYKGHPLRPLPYATRYEVKVVHETD